MAGAASATLKFLIFGEDKTASKAIKGVGHEAEQTHGKLGKLGSMAGGAMATGVGAAAVAAGALGYALMDATKGAIEDEKAASRLAQQLKNTTGASDKQVAAVEAYIAKAGVATGITDDQMRPAFQRLAASTHDIAKAQDLTNLAMDISASTGKDMTTVSNALAKANDGQVGALKKLGISLGDQALNLVTFQQEQKAVAKAQDVYNLAVEEYGPKSKQALDAAAKLDEKQAALNSTQKAGIDVMGELGKQFQGGAATAADTLGGRIGRLKLQFDEAKEAIGYKLIPVVTSLVEWFQDKAMPVISSMASKIMPKLREAFDRIKEAIEENRPQMEKLGKEIGVVAGIIVTKVVPVLIDLYSKYMVKVIDVIAAMGDALPPIASAFLRMASSAVDSLKDLLQAAAFVFGGILDAAAKGMGWIPGIGDKIKNAKTAFDDFKNHTIDRLTSVSAALSTAADKVDGWNSKAKSAATADIKANIDDLKTKIADAKERLAAPGLTDPEKSKIKAEISDLKDKVAESKDLLATVHDKEVTIKVNLHANQVKVRAKGSGEGEGGGGDFAGAVHSAAESVARAKAQHTNRVGSCLATVSSWVGGPHGVPKAIDAWYRGRHKHPGDMNPPAGVPVFWSGGSAGHVALSTGGGYVRSTDYNGERYAPGVTGTGRIGDVGRAMGKHYLGWTSDAWGKALAQGGIITARPGGMRAVIGEAGQDEAVIPLPSGWKQGNSIGGDTYNITVMGGLGDREGVARDVKLALLDLKKRSGGALLGLA